MWINNFSTYFLESYLTDIYNINEYNNLMKQ